VTRRREAVTDATQNVVTAASRGRSLVEQILAYSHSQQGKRVPVDVAGIVAETLELVRGSLPANIRLDAGGPPSPLLVIGDATRLHQVVMNLCSNAIQAMGAGGTPRASFRGRRRAPAAGHVSEVLVLLGDVAAHRTADPGLVAMTKNTNAAIVAAGNASSP
jgi:signal transduction histidine kinase